MPMPLSTFTCPLKIQLHVSRSTPHSHELTSSAIEAYAGPGQASSSAVASAASPAAIANRSSESVLFIAPMVTP